MKRIITLTVSLCMASSAFAGGYRVALQGQKALGMGHTGVAMSDSSEVVFFNPAGMSFLQSDMDITGGLTLIDSSSIYQNETVNASAETDNPIGTPVNFYLSTRHDPNLSYGIGLYTPYGNTVEWEKDWAGSHLVNYIELKTIFLQPTVAYQLNDQYSLGFGLIYVDGSVEFNRNLSTSLVDENGDRSNVTISASGITSWAYNFGFMARPSEALSIGLNYRSKADMEARGDKADFENIPSSLAAAYADTTFNADLVLPAELTLGIAYQINPELTLAFDINHTYWGEYKSLDVEFNNAAGTSENPRSYQDSNIYRIGVQYMMNNQLTLRGGLYRDESPIKEGYFAPETPRNDSLGFTAGASYQISKQMDLDFSLLILTFDEFKGSYDYYYDQSNGTTSSFGGSYDSSVTTIGFGLNYQF